MEILLYFKIAEHDNGAEKLLIRSWQPNQRRPKKKEHTLKHQSLLQKSYSIFCYMKDGTGHKGKEWRQMFRRQEFLVLVTGLGSTTGSASTRIELRVTMTINPLPQPTHTY
jgi:hypothetical protein